MSEERSYDAVIVGAGFAGLYALHRMRGLGLSARVYEAGDGVGGTWYWNRYPGARCDVESMQYSYQFSAELQQEWEWSERYAPQAEILRYLEHVAERFDLLGDVQLETRVESAHWDEAGGGWQIRTDRGERVSARFCIMATGCLSSANTPELEGMDSFEGDQYHTGHWPHEGVDFTGRRVGVIGTGSSAVQSIPLIAKEAKQLTVFQRTATYTVPAHNAPLDPATQASVKADYPGIRERAQHTTFGFADPPNEICALECTPEERTAEYEKRWAAGGLGFMMSFADLLLDRRANESAADFVRAKIRKVVSDPAIAEALSPNTVLACKRLCVDTGYWETYNRPNVSLVDISKAPIDRITPSGLETGGTEYALDAIVFATGFDAMTGALLAVDIRGVDGLPLRKKWNAGPVTYLGLMTSGFPNLFTVTGPGSPSVLTNMVPSIEQHVNFIADCIHYMKEQQRRRIEATDEAERSWVSHVNEIADATLFPTCNSWYLGANVPGKPRVFMPYLGFVPYVEKCEEVVAKGYAGFALT